MSKITHDCLTRSGTECFIPVPIWQRWALKVHFGPSIKTKMASDQQNPVYDKSASFGCDGRLCITVCVCLSVCLYMSVYVSVRLREEQHQQVMRRRQEMEREAAVSLQSKKTVDAVGSSASIQKLDEPASSTGRMTTRQNVAADDRSRTELAEKLKLRCVGSAAADDSLVIRGAVALGYGNQGTFEVLTRLKRSV